MKRLLPLLFLLSIVALPATAASTPKAGTLCPKAGKSAVVAGKKFTCIKSGKKLVWNKGTVIALPAPKPAPTPTPTPTPTTPPVVYLSTDSRITPTSELSPVAACKTSDVTPRFDVGLGFPRPVGAIAKKEAKVLVLPISFKDAVFDDADLATLKAATDKTRSFYQKHSYGQFDVTFVYPDKASWSTFTESANDYNLVTIKPQQNNTTFVEKIFATASESINFSEYDSVLLETAVFPSNGGGQGFPGVTFKARTGSTQRVSFDFGNAAGNYTTIAHEFGHSLFGLEDLYLFSNYGRPAGPWDLMSSDQTGFFGWTKFLLGWITDPRCVTTQTSSVHYLYNIDETSGPRLVTVNLADGVTLGVEARLGGDRKPGALVYVVDTNIHHGNGPITAEEKLLQRGEALSIRGWKVDVLGVDPKGVLVSLTRR